MSHVPKNIFFVGDSGCGKTSIIKTFCNGKMPFVSLPTTLEKIVTEVEVLGETFELNMWETICSRHFRVSGVQIRQSIYKETDLIVLVFNIAERKTLESIIEKWSHEIHLFCPKNIPIVLVGNKKDLRDSSKSSHSEKTVEYQEGLQVANQIGAELYIECSALTKENIQSLFTNVAKTLNKKNSSCYLL